MSKRLAMLLFLCSTLAVLGAFAFAGFVLYSDRNIIFELPGMSSDGHNTLRGFDSNPTVSLEVDQDDSQGPLELSFAEKLIRNKPYSAQIEGDAIQTLTDGSLLHRQWRNMYFRDADGRIRLEQTHPFSAASPSGPSRIKVWVGDPVANKSSVSEGDRGSQWTEPGWQKEFLFQFNKAKGVVMLNLPVLNDTEDIRRTALGVKQIEGMTCRGMKEDITLPIGIIGNQRAVRISIEIWYAPDIEAVVRSEVNDPRFGKIGYKLANVRLGPQPFSLFDQSAYKKQ
jgi:hypothetical protein